MTKTFALAFAGLLALSSTAFAKEATTTLHVKGWHCAACSAKTVKAVEGVQGVKTAKADRKAGTLTVTYDDAKVKGADLDQAVATAGFKAAN